MVVFVTGGSGSGKSVYGENLAVRLNRSELIYIATMKPFGNEGKKRVERHKKQRQGKGFITLEVYEDLHSLKLEKKPTVLLECMSNLLANEMFREDISWESVSEEEIGKKILDGVYHLAKQCDNVIIISNEIFGERELAEESTRRYTRCLGYLNQRLGEFSDAMCEVIYGYPYFYKKGDSWRRYEDN